MIEDFSAAALIAGWLVLFFALAFLALRRIVDVLVRRATKRRRMAEPETHGDAGGMPLPSEPGDEFYAKRRAGDKI